MDEAGIDSKYFTLLKNIYRSATFRVKISKNLRTEKISVNRDVRQSDPIFPKLLTLALDDVFKMLQWEQRCKRWWYLFKPFTLYRWQSALGIKVLKNMLENEAATNVGLKINISKSNRIMSLFQPSTIHFWTWPFRFSSTSVGLVLFISFLDIIYPTPLWPTSTSRCFSGSPMYNMPYPAPL